MLCFTKKNQNYTSFYSADIIPDIVKVAVSMASVISSVHIDASVLGVNFVRF